MKKRSKTGRRILRTFIFLLILAAAGAVFYFGFYQFQLPADSYGVIFTKYTGGGWHSDVIAPGSLRFEWEGLLPMNLSIESFTLAPIRSRVKIDGKLPSSDVYGMYLEGNPDFSYSYTFDLTYTLKPDSLYSLVSEDFLRENTFDEWIADTETGLSSDALVFLRKKADNFDYMNGISYNYRLIEDDLVRELSNSHDYLNIISFTPVDIEFPDLALYAEGRRQYFESESYRNEIQHASLEKTTDRIVEESAKLELLEKYGAIFAKYPQLIDYYSIFSADGRDMLPYIELPDLINSADLDEAETQEIRN